MLALTSPTSGGRSVGMVRSRTKATEFKLLLDRAGAIQSPPFKFAQPNTQLPIFWSYRLRSTCLTYHYSANAYHKWTHLKIVAYNKSHRRLQQYQCPALITVCEQSEDDEG
jgi:hypothetical protein